MPIDMNQFPLFGDNPQNSIMQLGNKLIIRDKKTRLFRKFYTASTNKKVRVYISFEFDEGLILFYRKVHLDINGLKTNQWLRFHRNENWGRIGYEDSHGNCWKAEWGVPFIDTFILKDFKEDYSYVHETWNTNASRYGRKL